MPALLESTADSAFARWSPGTGLYSPIQISLFGLVRPDWRIIQPLLITIERGDDDSFIASDDVFAMYGLGDDISEAIQDYISVLTEYYEVLSSHSDEPSISLFQRLQGYLQPFRR